jgi:hypothetical protein
MTAQASGQAGCLGQYPALCDIRASGNETVRLAGRRVDYGFCSR